MSKKREEACRAGGNCPCCGGQIEWFPDQDGSCDYSCARCGWYQHVPSDKDIALARDSEQE